VFIVLKTGCMSTEQLYPNPAFDACGHYKLSNNPKNKENDKEENSPILVWDSDDFI
jgi:hypothetical protein